MVSSLPSCRMLPGMLHAVFRQLVDGVHYLHSQEIAHRDIKLANLLIDNLTREIKIIDFGFSIKDQKYDKLYCGTLYYMAPELVRGGEYNTKKVDIWALGVVLYRLAVGKYPFMDRGNGGIKGDILRSQPDYSISVFRDQIGLRELIEGMLEVLPENRLSIEDVGILLISRL